WPIRSLSLSSRPAASDSALGEPAAWGFVYKDRTSIPRPRPRKTNDLPVHSKPAFPPSRWAVIVTSLAPGERAPCGVPAVSGRAGGAARAEAAAGQRRPTDRAAGILGGAPRRAAPARAPTGRAAGPGLALVDLAAGAGPRRRARGAAPGREQSRRVFRPPPLPAG